MDSRIETYKHKLEVLKNIHQIVGVLLKRAEEHDDTKLTSPEVEEFDKHNAKLKDLEYGTEEYKKVLEELKPALRHHYMNNRHHPEFWPRGVENMSLIDIMEMFADWMAACKRTKDGDLKASILKNQKRFNLSPQLTEILLNTARDLSHNDVNKFPKY